ncbi:MAG: JAB domain-containing protein [Bdellovibrionales bacterium]|nr:JAB domain-containing protein [Bdellovibrionales bacterium]
MKLSSINNSLDAYQYLKNRLRSPVEEIWVVCLHSNNKIIRSRCVFRGSVNFCNYHPRDIFRYTCLSNASKFILAHNHPSGESTPSFKDIEMTKKIKQISEIMDIPFIDHIICAKKDYYSFADNGWL